MAWKTKVHKAAWRKKEARSRKKQRFLRRYGMGMAEFRSLPAHARHALRMKRQGK